MAANVETMFYVSNETNGRFVPWHGLGTPVEDAPDSETAIIKASLDWKVVPHDVVDAETGIKIPNYSVNTRSSDNKPLGIVGSRYQIIQNKEAFAFTDSMLGEGVKYETAGSLKEGTVIWLLARMDSVDVLGDEVIPYLLFTNNHDGKGMVKVAMTPIRVVCNNTLNIALSSAERTWNTRHIGNLTMKLEDAKLTLGMATKYVDSLSVEADNLVNRDLSMNKIRTIVDALFPITAETSPRGVNSMEIARARFMDAYNAPDISKFRNTGWGIVNAMADYVDHLAVTRNTSNALKARENKFLKITNGHELLDNTVKLVYKVA